IRPVAPEPEPSPAGPPFLKFRDPAITNVPSVVFRAPLDVSAEQPVNGIFVADGSGTSVLAMENQDLGGGVVLSSLGGNPQVTPGGRVAFLATRAHPIVPGGPPVGPLGPAVLASRAAGAAAVGGPADAAGARGG